MHEREATYREESSFRDIVTSWYKSNIGTIEIEIQIQRPRNEADTIQGNILCGIFDGSRERYIRSRRKRGADWDGEIPSVIQTI